MSNAHHPARIRCEFSNLSPMETFVKKIAALARIAAGSD
jgi:hypothetical protein